MTVEEHWERFAVAVWPEERAVGRSLFFAGYAQALIDAEQYEGAQRVMDELREGKCG